MANTVARITEISASSDVSFEDAVSVGIERATKTLRGVTGAWVKDQKVEVVNGAITKYIVHLAVTFILDD
jgi:dodecin